MLCVEDPQQRRPQQQREKKGCETDAVDVADGRRREVVVDDQVDTLEVDAAAHQLRADQHPDAAGAEALHHVVALPEQQHQKQHQQHQQHQQQHVQGTGRSILF